MPELARHPAPDSPAAKNLASQNQTDADPSAGAHKDEIRHQAVGRIADLNACLIHRRSTRIVLDDDMYAVLAGKAVGNRYVVPIQIRRE